jgi:hypothetical protein
MDTAIATATAPVPVTVCSFYFAYCEAGFDARYLHNFHLTWVKESGDSYLTTADTPFHAPVAAGATAAGVSPLANAWGASSAAAVLQRELPSDPVNQLLLAIYFFLAGERDTAKHLSPSTV